MDLNPTSSEVWSQASYLAPYNYIIDCSIIEYDIEKANINVLYSKGAISKSTYEGLLNAPKQVREVAVGRMIRREKGLSTILSEGIADARKSLCEILSIESEDILSIKNDAVYVIYRDVLPPITEVQINGFIKFRPKGKYSSFYKIFRKEFYYDYDPITNMEGLDIKGVGDYGINLCAPFISMLCDLFYLALVSGPRAALSKVNEIYPLFVEKKYPIEFYRRLDSQAKFDIVNISDYCIFQADMLDGSNMYAVDGSYNSSILRLVMSYFTDMVMKKHL